MGNETLVSVPLGTFMELMELKGRVEAFTEFVNLQKYSVDRSECASLLGFELKAAGDDD